MSLEGLRGDFGFHYWGMDVYGGAMRPPGVRNGGPTAGPYVPHVDVFQISTPEPAPTYSRPQMVGRINPLSGAKLSVASAASRRDLGEAPVVAVKRPSAPRSEPTEDRPARTLASKAGAAEGSVRAPSHAKRSNHVTSTVETLVKRRSAVETPTDDGGSDTDVPEDIVPVDPTDESGDGGSDSPPADDPEPAPEDGGGGEGDSGGEPPDGAPIDDPEMGGEAPEDPGTIDPPPGDPAPDEPPAEEPPEGDGSDPGMSGEEGSGDSGDGSGAPGEDPPSDPPADPPPEDDGSGGTEEPPAEEPPPEEPPAEEPPAEEPPGEEQPPEGGDEPPIDIEA